MGSQAGVRHPRRLHTLIGASVAAMGITMSLRDDPDAGVATLLGMSLLAVLLAAVTCYVYRPLFGRVSVESRPPERAPTAPAHLEKSTR
jgi:hypothetical protein